jgi:hypothetical protein
MPRYPIALPVVWALHVWIVAGISPYAGVRGVLVAALFGLLASGLGAVVMRDRDRGGLLGGILAMLVVMGGRPEAAGVLGLVALLFVVERHGPRQLAVRWAFIGRQVARVVGILALAVVLEAVTLGRIADIVTAVNQEGPLRSAPDRPPAAASAPDVFVILLDGYARSDALRDLYGIDDRPFLEALEGRGFEVADDSHSNYPVTVLSLPSFLGYQLASETPGLTGGDGASAARSAVNDARGLNQFRELGYEVVATASGFEQTAIRTADRFFDAGQVNDFELELLNRSLPGNLVDAVAPQAFPGQQRARIEAAFTALESLARESPDRPRFVFAHVPAPHPPWVHRADGSPVRYQDMSGFFWWNAPAHPDLTPADVLAAYGEESAYVGSRTVDVADAILAQDDDAVVIVVSDHGASMSVGAYRPEDQLRNLFAARTPGQPGLFPEDVALAQVLPILLNAYAGLDLPPGPDRRFIFAPGGREVLVEVTPEAGNR